MPKWLRVSLRVLGVLALVFVLANAAMWIMYRNKVLPNYSVASVDIGNSGFDKLDEKVSVEKLLPSKVKLTKDDVLKEISPKDLGVAVDWKNVPGGTHTQQIALVQPNGVVYQTVSHSFAVADNKIGAPKLDDVIPIAGTFITQRNQVGEWTIQVSLDGQAVGQQNVEFAE